MRTAQDVIDDLRATATRLRRVAPMALLREAADLIAWHEKNLERLDAPLPRKRTSRRGHDDDS